MIILNYCYSRNALQISSRKIFSVMVDKRKNRLSKNSINSLYSRTGVKLTFCLCVQLDLTCIVLHNLKCLADQ